MKFLLCIIVIALYVQQHEGVRKRRRDAESSQNWLNHGKRTRHHKRVTINRNAAKRQLVPNYLRGGNNEYVDGSLSSNYPSVPREIHDTARSSKKSSTSKWRSRNKSSTPSSAAAAKRSLWRPGNASFDNMVNQDPFSEGKPSAEDINKINDDLDQLTSKEATSDRNINLNEDLADLQAKYGITDNKVHGIENQQEVPLAQQQGTNYALDEPALQGVVSDNKDRGIENQQQVPLAQQQGANYALDENELQGGGLESLTGNVGLPQDQEQNIFNSIKHKLDRLTDNNQVTDSSPVEYSPSLATAMPSSMMDSIYSLAGYPGHQHSTPFHGMTGKSVPDINELTGKSVSDINELSGTSLPDMMNGMHGGLDQGLENYLQRIHNYNLKKNHKIHRSRHAHNGNITSNATAVDLASKIVTNAVNGSKIRFGNENSTSLGDSMRNSSAALVKDGDRSSAAAVKDGDSKESKNVTQIGGSITKNITGVTNGSKSNKNEDKTLLEGSLVNNMTKHLNYSDIKITIGESSKNENSFSDIKLKGGDSSKSENKSRLATPVKNNMTKPLNYSDTKTFPLTSGISEKARGLHFPKSFNDEVDYLANIIMSDMSKIHHPDQSNGSTNAAVNEVNKNDVLKACPENKLCSNESPIEIDAGNTSVNADASNGIETSPIATNKDNLEEIKKNNKENLEEGSKKNKDNLEEGNKKNKENMEESDKRNKDNLEEDINKKKSSAENYKHSDSISNADDNTSSNINNNTESEKKGKDNNVLVSINVSDENGTIVEDTDTVNETTNLNSPEKNDQSLVTVTYNNEDEKWANSYSASKVTSSHVAEKSTEHGSRIEGNKTISTSDSMKRNIATQNADKNITIDDDSTVRKVNSTDGLVLKASFQSTSLDGITPNEIMGELNRIEGSVLTKALMAGEDKKVNGHGVGEVSKRHWTDAQKIRFNRMNSLLQQRILQRMTISNEGGKATHSKFADRLDRLVDQLKKSALARKRSTSNQNQEITQIQNQKDTSYRSLIEPKNYTDFTSEHVTETATLDDHNVETSNLVIDHVDGSDEQHQNPLLRHPSPTPENDDSLSQEIIRKNVLTKGAEKANELIKVLSDKEDVKPEFASVLADITTYDIRAKNIALSNLPPAEEDPFEKRRREKLKTSLQTALQEYMTGANKQVSHVQSGIKKFSYLNLDNTLDERRDLELHDGTNAIGNDATSIAPDASPQKEVFSKEEDKDNLSGSIDNVINTYKIYNRKPELDGSKKEDSDSQSKQDNAMIKEDSSLNNKPQVVSIKVNSLGGSPTPPGDGTNRFNSSRALLDILDLNEALTNIIKVVESSGKDFPPEKLLLVRSILKSMNSFYTEIENENAKSVDKTSMEIRGILKSNILKEGTNKVAVLHNRFDQMENMMKDHRLERLALEREIEEGYFVPDEHILKDYDIDLKKTLLKKKQFHKLNNETLNTLLGDTMFSVEKDNDASLTHHTDVFKNKHNATRRTLEDIIDYNNKILNDMPDTIREEDEGSKRSATGKFSKMPNAADTHKKLKSSFSFSSAMKPMKSIPNKPVAQVTDVNKVRRDEVARISKEHIFQLIEKAKERMKNLPKTKRNNAKRNEFVKKIMKSMNDLYSTMNDLIYFSHEGQEDVVGENTKKYIDEKKGVVRSANTENTGSKDESKDPLHHQSGYQYKKLEIPVYQDTAAIKIEIPVNRDTVGKKKSFDNIEIPVYQDTAAKKIEIPENRDSVGEQVHVIDEELLAIRRHKILH